MTAPARPATRRAPRITPGLRALRRAARAAYRLARETGTPFYVWKDGKVVDLLATKALAKKRRREPGPGSAPRARSTRRVQKVTASR